MTPASEERWWAAGHNYLCGVEAARCILHLCLGISYLYAASEVCSFGVRSSIGEAERAVL